MIESIKLSELFEITSSKRVFKEQWTEEGVPFYRTREIVKLADNKLIQNELYISNEMYNTYSKKYGIPQSGDLLVTGVGTIGICYQVKANDKFYFKDGNIIWLKKKSPNVDSLYVEYAFKSELIKRQISKGSDGATVGTFTITNANKIQIPLPPLEEQKRIAAILDAADQHRQKTKELIAKYDELSQSLFLDMFGDPSLFKQLPIAHIASKEKYALSSGPFGSNLTSKHYKEDGVVVLRGTNVTSGELNLENVKYISFDKAEELKRSALKPGDVVVVAVGSSGRALQIPTTLPVAVMSQNFNKITPDLTKTTSTYLEYCFNSQLVQNQFKKEMTDTVRTFLSLTKIKEVIIPIPPLEVQIKFENQIQEIEKQKVQAQESLKKAEDLFQSLLQKAFKGEL